MKKFIALCLSACLSISCLFGCGQKEPEDISAFFFDTVIRIQVFDPPDAALEEEILSICKKYDRLLSVDSKSGDIYRINHAKGETVKVNPETAALIKKAFAITEETKGAFDVTIEPVSSLWTFGGGTDEEYIPTKDELKNALTHTGTDKFRVTDHSVTKRDPEAGIDLGGIGKGFIADKIKKHLEKRGVKSALINLGGNLVAVGSRTDGTPFHVGIQKPFADAGTVITDVNIRDRSTVTSGVYERYYRRYDTLYHHLLNPKTGMPENNGLSSVTIVSDSSLTGDALSTAVFIKGLKEGKAFVKSHPEIKEAIFVTATNKVLRVTN